MGSEQDSFAKEIELIAKYKDTLVNLTVGGEGAGGGELQGAPKQKEQAMPSDLYNTIEGLSRERGIDPQQVQGASELATKGSDIE